MRGSAGGIVLPFVQHVNGGEPPLPGGHFDGQVELRNYRMRALPRMPIVRGAQGHEVRCGLRKVGQVQPCRAEDRFGLDRFRNRRRIHRGDGGKPAEFAGGIQAHLYHIGKRGRRIGGADVAVGLRHEQIRTLPVDREHGRLGRKPLVPPVRFGEPVEVMQEVLLVGQPDGRIGRSFRIAEGRGHLPRLAGQYLRRIVHGSVERGDGAALQHHVRRQANPDGHEAKHGVPARHSLPVASGRHQFGRRRLTSRQRRGQRIAARKRHCHRKRAGRPLGGVGIEATADGFFHHRVDVRGGRGHARQMDGLLHLEQLPHVLGIVRFFAGEELIKHQPQRVDIASGGDLGALQLLGRHVSRGHCALRRPKAGRRWPPVRNP